MSHFKNILSDLLYSTQKYCRLCFELATGEALLLQDKVTTNSGKNTEDLSTILSLVLGDEIVNYFSRFDRVCEECVNTALMSYSFISKCKENYVKLVNSVESLSFCVNDIDDNNISKSKTMFLTINPIDFSNEQYYSIKKSPTTLPEAYKQFCRIMKYKLIQQTKMDENDDDEIFFEQVNQNGEIKYCCKYCPKKFKVVEKVQQHHIDKHTNLDTFVCFHCGEIFNEFQMLKIHEQQHNYCRKCNKVYKGRTYFQRHICQKERLRDHLKKNYVCDYCGATFVRLPTLLLHIKFEHGNGVPLVCMWCSKKFYAKSMLKMHERKHTKEKNFKCDLCSGQFVTKASLLYHTRTHTGEKPYKCKHCDLTFLSSSRRADHVRRAHIEASLPCDICHKKFKAHSALSKHRKRHLDPNSTLFIDKEKYVINYVKNLDGY